ncbi:hypothetical protein KKG90_09135 [Candidatus Bipolaricaulota bacterium]|nr:hypothetical protein [Candidatus Bipolaricaulota bacterium]
MATSASEILKTDANLIDEGLEAGFRVACAGTTVQEIKDAVNKAILNLSSDADVRIEVEHGVNPDGSIESAEDTQLENGELVRICVVGKNRTHTIAGGRTSCVGSASVAQQGFLDHLAEASVWFRESLLPGSRRPFVAMETRARLLQVRAGRLDCDPDAQPLIEIGKPVSLDEHTSLWTETILTCPEFGTAVTMDMVAITQNGADLLTRSEPVLNEHPGG